MVALASQESSEPIRTFSVGFDESDMSELPHAREVAERYGSRHTEYVLKPHSVDNLPMLVAHFDEPFGDSSALPCRHIAEVAAREVKVCLSGDGGDEAFAGYNAYATSLSLRGVDAVPLALRQLLLGPIERRLPEWARGKGFLRLLTSTAADRYAELMVGVDCSTRKWLLCRDFYEATSVHHPYDRIRALYRAADGLDEVARLQRVDLQTYLPDDILVKTDRTSMLHSLELRVPMLDSKVLELALKMPTHLKIHGRERKRILKTTFGHLLPPAILARGKQGFGIPRRAWLRGDLRGLVSDVFGDPHTRQRGIFSPAGLDRLLVSSQRGSRDLGNEVWSVLVLELWLRQIVDGKVGTTALIPS